MCIHFKEVWTGGHVLLLLLLHHSGGTTQNLAHAVSVQLSDKAPAWSRYDPFRRPEP